MSGADRRFRAPREERWRALDELIQRPLSSLSAAEVDALARLHRLAAGDLAAAPLAGAAPQTQAELHARVARGRRALYRPPAIPMGQAISRFYARTLPRLVRANLLAVLASAALVLIPMALTWQAGRGDPGRAYAMASPAQREGARAFTLGWEAGTQGEDKAAASAFYISNNTSVALRAFAGGITLGVLTVWSLIYNGIQLGTTLALVEALGAQRNLGAFVVVHGPAELMAIALAAAGGLVLAGALLRPGARTRAASLAQRAPDALGLAVGAATLLALAGLLEGAVSPSALAPATKVGIGAGVTAAVLLWLGLMGRRSQGGDPEAIAAGQPADAASPEIPIRSPTGGDR